ncbi:MAG TPA: ABC transporter permease [Dehalococcoidia bacterium]|nr:ABC transporter permease [Dehalococcoidia bacterium]
MNGDIIRLTIRQQLTLGRVALMLLLIGLPILVAVVEVAAGGDEDDRAELVTDLLDQLVLLGVLPIIALLIGTGALGNEVAEGTAPYLVLKPISRATIILSKLAVAAVTTGLLVGVAVLVSGLIALSGEGSTDIVIGFLVASLLGALAYCAWFVLLSLLTSRAFVVGLLYVFIWEGVITSIFRGARYVSVRHYSQAIADGLADLGDALDASLSPAAGIIGIAIITVAATWLAVERLKQFEVHDRTI